EHSRLAGTCGGRPAPDCNDNDPCSTDTCLPAVGCQHVSVSGCRPCNMTADCDDDNGCTSEECVDRTCRYQNITAACDDGNACTSADHCAGGKCIGSAVTCAPTDQCHAAGVCQPASGTCTNPPRPDDTSCNDGDACTQTDRCEVGVCTGSSPVVCPNPDTCHLPGTCDPSSGQCSNPAKGDGSVCDDGDFCTVSDHCVAGACVSVPRVCDDRLA